MVESLSHVFLGFNIMMLWHCVCFEGADAVALERLG